MLLIIWPEESEMCNVSSQLSVIINRYFEVILNKITVILYNNYINPILHS